MQVSLKRSLCGLSAVAALALVPAGAQASVSTTTLEPIDRAFMPFIPVGGNPADVFYQVKGTAPGASAGDEVDIVCYNSQHGNRELADGLVVDGGGVPAFATAAVTDVANALKTISGTTAVIGDGPLNTSGINGGPDHMCNVRAVPAQDGGPWPASTSGFQTRPVGFGYLEERGLGGDPSDFLRQDYQGVANNVNGRWRMTSAGGSNNDDDGGDDGLRSGRVFRGSNFNQNNDSIIDEVAFLTADEGPSGGLFGAGLGALSGAGIIVDSHRGRLSDRDHQLNSLEGGSHVDVTRTVNALTGDVTITERQRVNQCRDTDAAFPSIFDCWILGGDYEDSGVDLTRVYQTSNGGQTVSIIDTWRNHSLDEILPVGLRYENNIEDDSAVGYGAGPIERRDPGDSPDLSGAARAAGPFSMILDGDEDDPENDDSADDGAVTYLTRPNEILFKDEDEWTATFSKQLSPGDSLVVSQVWNQTDTLAQALAAAGLAETPATATNTITNNTTQVVREIRSAAPAAGAVQQQAAGSARSCSVPRLRGRSRLAAERALVRAGCAVGKVSRKSSRRMKAGKVLSQSRSAGSIVAAGTKVNLAVAKKAKRARKG